MENGKKWLSEASDEWKTGKNGFPRPRMSGKLKKMCFQPLGEPKNAENAHRRLTKRRNREKTLIVGRRNAKNAEKCPSSADEMQKTPKKCLSSADEMQKTPKNSLSYPSDEQKTLKTAFRRGTINKKRQKQPFVGVRRTENGENRLSAAADE